MTLECLFSKTLLMSGVSHIAEIADKFVSVYLTPWWWIGQIASIISRKRAWTSREQINSRSTDTSKEKVLKLGHCHLRHEYLIVHCNVVANDCKALHLTGWRKTAACRPHRVGLDYIQIGVIGETVQRSLDGGASLGLKLGPRGPSQKVQYSSDLLATTHCPGVMPYSCLILAPLSSVESSKLWDGVCVFKGGDHVLDIEGKDLRWN